MLGNNEMILNWRNILSKDASGERLVVSKAADDLKDRGFSKRQASDMLLADSYSDTVVEEVLDELFPSERTSEAKDAKTAFAAVTPNSYAEAVPQIEASLQSLEPRVFVDGLTQTKMPIVRTSKQGYESLVRLAELAKNELIKGVSLENRVATSKLHEYLEPYIGTVMLDSVLLAERIPGKVYRLSARGENAFRVVTAHEKVDVDLNEGTSTGARYLAMNLGTYGIADEHIVRAAEAAHPYERLKRAIKSA